MLTSGLFLDGNMKAKLALCGDFFAGGGDQPHTLNQPQTVRFAFFIWLCDLRFMEPQSKGGFP
jgi:hypothetical protein